MYVCVKERERERVTNKVCESSKKYCATIRAKERRMLAKGEKLYVCV